MKFEYKTKGTCSQKIIFDINDDVVTDIKFISGCNGNLKGISALCEGQKAEDIVKRLKGIKCGFKNTSCPDQFALAIEEALKNRTETS